jgi:hypothetical protein
VGTRPKAHRPGNLLAGDAITLPVLLNPRVDRNSIGHYPEDLTCIHHGEWARPGYGVEWPFSLGKLQPIAERSQVWQFLLHRRAPPIGS